MADGAESRTRVAIVTVHGTGDTAEGVSGDKWFQDGSDFTTRLKRHLAQAGIEADILPHLWSGANSAREREKGALKLAKSLQRSKKQYRDVHVIGHSHGGNVANDAACAMRWRPTGDAKGRLASVVTVGTPFFKSQLSRMESFGAWAFMAIAVLSILELIAAGASLLILYWHTSPSDGLGGIGAIMMMWGVPIFSVLVLVSLFFLLPIAWGGLRRIRRIRTKQHRAMRILSLWHPQDEAIAFLQRLESLTIEPFPRGALLRRSHLGAIVWGVGAVVIPIGLAIVGILAGFAVGDHLRIPQAGGGYFDGQQLTTFSYLTASTALGMAPLTFTLIYLLSRLFRGVAMEWGFRGHINRGIGDALRGIAFGRDGDERIGKIATGSHSFETDAVMLDGEVAERMRLGARKTADELLEKYRWAMFTVGASGDAAFQDLATDAMTWNSLIHTTYFDQPELAEMIARHIAEQTRLSVRG